MSLIPFAHLLGLPKRSQKAKRKGAANSPTRSAALLASERRANSFRHLNDEMVSEAGAGGERVPASAHGKAAAILAAAAKARSSTEGPPEPPPGSLAAKILAAGRKAREGQ